MSVYTITNRLPKPDHLSSDRNPGGNMWYVANGKPFNRFAYWFQSDKSAVLSEIKSSGKPVALFIHGFNESPERAWGIGQAIFDALAQDFTAVLYLWDSAGSVFGYFGDRQRAQKSAADLLDVLKALDCPNVIAHSMGNYLLQLSLALVNGTTEALINHLAMVAADVPQDVLLPSQSNIAAVCNSGVVMWSPADPALAGSSIIHEFKPRLGFTGPMGDCPANFKSVDCTGHLKAVLNPIDVHGDYFRSPECWQIIRNSFSKSSATAA